jgi:hypothetical protein
MGDITGRPKAPAAQVVYVPQYVYTNNPSTPSSNDAGQTPNTPDAPTPEQQRERNLLSRSRSRIGTVLTGFRGILAPTDTQNQRKTLLGE